MSRQSRKLPYKISRQYDTDIDLVEELLQYLGEELTIKTLEMNPQDLLKTARVNFLKVTRKEAIENLHQEGIIASAINEVKEGIKIISGWEKLGYSQSYLQGEIMPQGLGSMLTVEALNPQPGDKILDMAAAPGGKSCFIGEKLDSQGLIISNDISKKRIRSLILNLARHNVSNVIVLNQDGNKINGSKFDRILLDAPCSGGGLIVSLPERRNSKNMSNSLLMQKIQISLLQNALKLLIKGGTCVYSTCAISPIENEMVVNHFVDKIEIKPLEILGNTGDLTVNAEFKNAKRLFPSIHYCDGFFIVKMVKL